MLWCIWLDDLVCIDIVFCVVLCVCFMFDVDVFGVDFGNLGLWSFFYWVIE